MRVLATLQRGSTLVVLRDRAAAGEVPASRWSLTDARDAAAVDPVRSGPVASPARGQAAEGKDNPDGPDTRDPTQSVPAQAFSHWRWEDAERYLWFWRGDGAAVHQLRHALQRITHGMHLVPVSDEQVMRTLAAHLCAGTLAFHEDALMVPLPANLRPPPPTVADALPAPPPVPGPVVMAASVLSQLPLLPLLEEVQIEGADVLPEIMQSLEQVDLTMENIDLASVSLEPTPSRIPDIQTALGDATGAVNGVLDAL